MRVLNMIFIVFFLTMITLPLIFIDIKRDRISEHENRRLANFPELSIIKNDPGRFKRQFESWFKDSTGFREQMLAIYNIIEKNRWINGIRYTNGQYVYLIGEQGHHYFAYVNGNLIQKFQGKQFLSDQQLNNLSVKLEEVNAFLINKGIPFVVMLCTDKESVYPEFYPKAIKQGTEPIQLDVITKYLQENTSVDVFNIKQALLEEKKNYLLYNISSGDLTHYNEIGSFFAYRELMRHITPYFPNIIPYNIEDVSITYDEKEIPHVSLKTEKTYIKLDSSFFDDINIQRPFTRENDAYENMDADLPVILFMRDSYVEEQFIGKYIANHFGKAIFISFLNMANFYDYVEYYKPDIVVFESAERELQKFTYYVEIIPNIADDGSRVGDGDQPPR